jgi:hypothetical protein
MLESKLLQDFNDTLSRQMETLETHNELLIASNRSH